MEPRREFTMNCRPASGIRGRHRQAAQPRQWSVAWNNTLRGRAGKQLKVKHW